MIRTVEGRGLEREGNRGPVEDRRGGSRVYTGIRARVCVRMCVRALAYAGQRGRCRGEESRKLSFAVQAPYISESMLCSGLSLLMAELAELTTCKRTFLMSCAYWTICKHMR